MDGAALKELGPAARRRLLGRALLRSLLTVVGLLVLYYLLPMDRVRGVQLLLLLAAGLAAVVGLCVWEVRAILRSQYPAVQAVQGLATAVPMFLLLFATVYFVLAGQGPAAFTQPLNRTDALYFTVTVFATVGFGDIAPVTQAARIAVTVQMVANLLVLGILLRAVTGAVQLSRARRDQTPVD
jgi:voltage-gated potassium channel